MFDKAAVFQLVDQGLEPGQRRMTTSKELALAACLDELGQRMRSKGFIRSYTATVTANTRSYTVRGDSDDLKSIYALKIGSGDEQRVLEYTDPQQFLRDYDDPNATAGMPSRFTVLVADEGFPVVRFNCPLESAESLLVYYHISLTPDNVGLARSISAAVAGTLAYFFGTTTEAGVGHYQRFRELVKLGREADSFTPDVSTEFRLCKQDRDIRVVTAQLRSKRN